MKMLCLKKKDWGHLQEIRLFVSYCLKLVTDKTTNLPLQVTVANLI